VPSLVGDEAVGLRLALGPADTDAETDADADADADPDADSVAPAGAEGHPAEDAELVGDELGATLDVDVDTDGLGVGDGTALDAAVDGQTSAART
jgi:hypothetical protein